VLRYQQARSKEQPVEDLNMHTPPQNPNAQPTAPDAHYEIKGAAGVVTFARASALNALTIAMRATFHDALVKFARDPQIYGVIIQSAHPKAFSSGGDVRELLQLAGKDIGAARKALADEYALNWRHECFSKPSIALIDGIAMGSGVGVTSYGTHRVAGERYSWAMPETVIGYCPDVGAAHTLSHMPWPIGIYLALTGYSVGRADAYWLGLVTHCIPATRFPEIVNAIADAQPIDELLDGMHVDPGEDQPIKNNSELIRRYFSGTTVEDIFEALKCAPKDDQAFSAPLLADIEKRPPLSLKVTLRHVQEAKARDLRQTLMVDYRLACRFIADHDFREGVRAALIDKDQKPKWVPSTLTDATNARVDDYFRNMGAEELVLPTRQEMQEMRA
jgi:enoyl-CoA hydratase